VSIVGSVFGIAATAVMPPCAAASAPLSIVSSSSRPGSLRWTCMSTRPGETTAPRTSITSVSSSTGVPSPHFATRSLARRRSM